MLSIIFNPVMVSVIMLNVIMLSVVAPFRLPGVVAQWQNTTRNPMLGGSNPGVDTGLEKMINILLDYGKMLHLHYLCSMRVIQLPVSATRWQHGSQICFELLLCKKSRNC